MVHRDQFRWLNTHIGERIKSRRRQQRLSQTDLGKTVDLTFQQVQKYEHGKNRIDAALLFYIAKNLNVPITYFFEGISSDDLQEQNNSSVIDLLQVIYQLPEKAKDSLHCFICDVLEVPLHKSPTGRIDGTSGLGMN